MSDDVRATVFCRAPWLGDADWLETEWEEFCRVPWLGDADWLEAEWEESEYLPGDEDDSSDVVEAETARALQRGELSSVHHNTTHSQLTQHIIHKLLQQHQLHKYSVLKCPGKPQN